MFDQRYQKILQKFPDKEKWRIFYETTQLVLLVKNFDGTANITAYNTRAAIDIKIIAKDGELIDMEMAIKDWQK